MKWQLFFLTNALAYSGIVQGGMTNRDKQSSLLRDWFEY
jgi:hypothetical protein